LIKKNFVFLISQQKYITDNKRKKGSGKLEAILTVTRRLPSKYRYPTKSISRDEQETDCHFWKHFV